MLNFKQIYKYINFVLLFAFMWGVGAPGAGAATSQDIRIAGWIPYWSIVAGAKDAENHLDVLDTVHPFGYSVKTDGTLNDLAKVSRTGGDSAAKAAWQSLFTSAKNKDVKVVPTVMWSSGADIHRILSSKSSRTKHIKAIASMVKKEKFDGVNIDYEGKFAETKNDFSAFLKELKKELGKNKILSCAIEARTPPESLYRVVPATLQYANDFKAIGKYCDEVELMTYDQDRADIKLNSEKAGFPYMPIADKDWVRKVAVLAMKDISREKIILGVATYGHEYVVTVSPNFFQNYKEVQSMNSPYALEVARAYKITPSRNQAGELSLSYLPLDGTAERNTLISMLPKLTVPAGTASGEIIAQKALAYANTTGKSTSFNYITWSDAQAIQDKLELARQLGLGGIVLFKIDAEEDPAVWGIMK
jgi:spore germination protein YaaH